MENAYEIVREFEMELCRYTGATYAVALDTGCDALYLSLAWQRAKMADLAEQPDWRDYDPPGTVTIPRHTFVGVPMMAINAGWRISWDSRWAEWTKQSADPVYPIDVVHPPGHPHFHHSMVPQVWDAAIGFKPGIYSRLLYRDAEVGAPSPFVCCSFQYRKHLPIGRGGAILHANPAADEWFRRKRFYGRHEVPTEQEAGPELIGWNMTMEPERAARGLTLLMRAPRDSLMVPNLPIGYPDLSTYEVFKSHVDS